MIGAIGDLDSPKSMDAKGFASMVRPRALSFPLPLIRIRNAYVRAQQSETATFFMTLCVATDSSPAATPARPQVRWILGVTEAQRQRARDQVLATSPADVAAFADRLDRLAARGSVAVVGSGRALAEANDAMDTPVRLAVRSALG